MTAQEYHDTVCRLREINASLLAACERALAESVGQPSRRISPEGLNVIRSAIAAVTKERT